MNLPQRPQSTLKTLPFAILAVILLQTATIGYAEEDNDSVGSLLVGKRTPMWKLADTAEISITAAIAKALIAYPGNVIEAELEVEDGALVFQVVLIRSDRSVVEVIIDAGDGMVLEVEIDD